MKQKIILLFVFFTICGCNQEKTIELKDENGNVLESYQVINDTLKHGVYKAFYNDGKLSEQATFEEGKLQGIREIFYPSGAVEIREIYLDNLLHGPYKVFYEDGQILLDGNYRGGVLEGSVKKYYANGQQEEDVTFQNNVENGPFKEFYPNGNLHWEGNYLNGENEFGTLKKYDESGNHIRTLICDSLAVCKTIWQIKS